MATKLKIKPNLKKIPEQKTVDSDTINSYAKKLFKAADALRKNIDAGEYKHTTLGLIFLKYISDAFEERRRELIKEKSKGADPDERTEYSSVKVFWVPEESRWSKIRDSAKNPKIGKIIDDAMIAIERENDSLKGVLPKDYANPKLDKMNLGKLVDLFSNINLGEKTNQSKDVLGRIYEYFLGKFASSEGKKGGQFYTPYSVVRLLVKMIQPTKGRLYEPCCGSGGMIVQSENLLEKEKDDLLFYGQESNQTTWRLCKMNLAIRAIDAEEIRWNSEGSFLRDEHKNLKADYILANPPFNDSEWSGERLKEDNRWKYGIPPPGNANFAWIQHFIHHLSSKGVAGFVLSKSSLITEKIGQDDIRKSLITNDLIECIVTLPSQLFFSTGIPACLWFISKQKTRKNEILFIDAQNMGNLVDKSHRELEESEITEISDIFHAWKNNESKSKYEIPGFSTSIKLEQIKKTHYYLSPRKYVRVSNMQTALSNTYPKDLKKILDLFEETIQLEKKIIENIDKIECHNYLNSKEILKILKSKNVQSLKFLLDVLFRTWFVDYNFPDKKNKPFVINGGELIDSEVGEIPNLEDWEIGFLKDKAHVIDCLHAPKPPSISSGKLMLQVFNISNNYKINLNKKYFISEKDYKKWTSRIEVTKGDCVITNVGRVGAIASVTKGIKAAIGRNMTAIRGKEEVLTPTYLFQYMISSRMDDQIDFQIDESTITDSLNVRGIYRLRIIVPPYLLLKKYEDISRPILDLIETLDNLSSFSSEASDIINN